MASDSDGNIRIWTKDGDQPRSGNDIKQGGNLVMDGAIYTAAQLGFTDNNRTITLYVEGHRVSSSLGNREIIVAMDYDFNGQTIHVEDAVKYTVKQQEFEMAVDTNRDNVIDDLDKADKDTWTNSRGAIILYNGDDDEDAGYQDNLDNIINNQGDIDDIGQLRVTKPDTSQISGDWSVVLTLAPVLNEDPYWNQYGPDERVRIFLPTLHTATGDIVCQAGDVGILGGTIYDTHGNLYFPGVPSVTFTNNSYDPNLDLSLFEGVGSVYFGIEGLIPGAPVRIISQLYAGLQLVQEEIVEVKVTPFIAFSHESPVERDTSYGPTVFVALDYDNSELRTNLRTKYDTLLSEVPVNSIQIQNTDSGGNSRIGDDTWWQDPFEIGYVQAPYGSQYVIFALPRSNTNLPNDFLNYAKNSMIRNGVGIFEKFAIGQFDDQDDGGNFEVMPGINSKGTPFGTIVMGKGSKSGTLNSDGSVNTDIGFMNERIVDFLIAQGVQDVISDIDLSWMSLGHIDEVISFATTPDGRARVASPEAAYALLLHAKQNLGVSGTQPVFSGMNYYIERSAPVHYNFSLDGLIQYIQGNSFYGPNSFAEKIRTNITEKLGFDSQNYTIRNSIGGISQYSLTRIGYLEGNDHFGNGRMVEWKLEFTSNIEYNLYYRKDNTLDPWIYDGTGNRNTDFISNSGMVYILHTWWGYATTAGQGVIFATYPSPDIIEMPVLFYNYRENFASMGAKAFTNNVINSLVDGNTLFCPHVYGPLLDPSDPSTSVFNNYVSHIVTKDYLGKDDDGSIVLKGGDFSNVIFSNDFGYHYGFGSIHCGTNVLRKMPAFDSGKEWWMLFD